MPHQVQAERGVLLNGVIMCLAQTLRTAAAAEDPCRAQRLMSSFCRPALALTLSLTLALAVLTLTLTNPATILFFVAAFGAVGFTGIGHGSPDALIHAGLVVAGTFTGSMLWWVLVTGIARRLRGRITDNHLRLLNRGTAVALGLFAIAAVVSGVTAR